ncbi:MAG: Cof-type HAD-IIB family hydrolase [Eubacteriales bacterium]|nr:Cof-type HAD-IIB family hydrolase [Eubacteriales bacterium]
MKKDIKVIGLDLDGTLLTPDKKLSKANYKALLEAHERGIEIVPSTGRYFSAMPECIRTLPFINFSININGATVKNIRTGEVVYKAEIPLSEALDIMNFLHDKPALYDCYMNDHGWITGSFKALAEQYVKDPHYIDMVKNLRESVPELRAFITEQGRDIQKIQFFTYDHDFQQEMLHHGAELFPDIICTSSVRDENVEFNNIKANKGDALVGLAKYLGYEAENTMSFGDGSNDVPMIKAAGVGVAMANACPEAIEAADIVTLSNAEDGVAKVIREYCLQ